MKRIVCSGDESILEFDNCEEPSLLANECLVRVKAFSLNRGEVSFATGKEQGTSIGWDIAGVVEHSSSDGIGPAKGERVVGFCRPMDGWAELVAVPSHSLAVIPKSISFEDAATLPVAGLTALYSIDRATRLIGNRVLVTGANGGVGLFATQLASLGGAYVVAQVRKSVNSELLYQHKANEVVVSESGDEVSELEPFRLIVDGVGGELFGKLPLISPDGVLVSYGITAGSKVNFDLYPGFFGGTSRRSIYSFRLHSEAELEPISIGLKRLLSLLETGKISVTVERKDNWDKASEVARAFLDRKFSGKAVLSIN